MSIRRLAGSRRNKHLPIARTPRRSDIRNDSTPAHRHAAGWVDYEGCGAECRCGVGYDGLYSLREADAHLDRHIARARFGGKPDHTARAVDITTIWPPLPAGGTTRQRLAAEAGARGVSAAPMHADDRAAAYKAQTGSQHYLTLRQHRQLERMARLADLRRYATA